VDADAVQSGATLLGIVSVVVGVLVWAIKKIVDMLDARLIEFSKSFSAFTEEARRTREELAGLKSALQSVAHQVEVLALSHGEVTPPPRFPKVLR